MRYINTSCYTGLSTGVHCTCMVLICMHVVYKTVAYVYVMALTFICNSTYTDVPISTFLAGS